MPYYSDSSCSSDSSSEESDSSGNHCKRKASSKKPRRKFQKQYTHQRPRNSDTSQRQAGVYVLKNSSTNVLYVGKSENMSIRIQQHIHENRPAILTRENTLTNGSIYDLESWERNEVLTRMYRHGMESVRGWRYTRRGQLTPEERISARNDIMEKFDLCRRCGHNNHFAGDCFARSPASWCRDVPMQ